MNYRVGTKEEMAATLKTLVHTIDNFTAVLEQYELIADHVVTDPDHPYGFTYDQLNDILSSIKSRFSKQPGR